MSASEGNSLFCFPKSLNVSRDEVEGNIEYDACDVILSVYPHRPKLEKYAWPRWEPNLQPLEY